MTDRQDILIAIQALDQRLRDEQERHRGAMAAMRGELHRLVQRGEEQGLSITSMAKALNVSRGRLNRMLDDLR